MSTESKTIPLEATQALKIVRELLGSAVVGAYLFGSAVVGGLQVNSDVDVLVVVNRRLPAETRKDLVTRLMEVSGKIGNTDSIRPLEVTIINKTDVVPWRYPPKNEFIYGEWLREQYKGGQIPEPAYDPDLAIVLKQIRENSISLVGPDASDMLDLVPMKDIRRAIKESMPGLMEGIKGDERNVILTLARMWLTVTVGEISSKDAATSWAIPRLPKEQAALLDLARRAYRGEGNDSWEGREHEIIELVGHMKLSIESGLGS